MKVNLYEGREQTEVKHRILRRYLSAFAPIVGNWAADVAYIDCLAGPWESRGDQLEDTSFSIAVNVLKEAKATLALRGKYPSFRSLLIENDPESFLRLSEFASKATEIAVTAKPWDFSTHINDIVHYATERKKSFPFFFIDPKGWELIALDLITPILKLQPGEVLINLMTSWIKRFLSDESKNFERLVGSEAERLRRLTGDEQEEELVRCYADAIKKSGKFEYVCTLPVLKADADMFHFWMIYGTRHPKGVEVFKSTEKSIVPFMHETRAESQQRKKFLQSGGQFPLLEPEATYVERRLTRLQDKNQAFAKESLLKLLKTSREVLYDSVWAQTMQFSLVTENDLKDWVRQLVADGHLQVDGMSSSARGPKRQEGQKLRWIG